MTGAREIYNAVLGPNVRFQKLRHKLFIPATLSTILLPTANSMNAEEARRYCDSEIKRLGIDHGFKQIVETLLRSRLATAPTEKETSRLLGCSPRNFRRQLAEEGTNYRNLLNSIKLESAMTYLTTTHLSIEEIACEIGYKNVGNFSRAFKRWTGITPSTYRRHPTDMTEDELLD